MVDDKLFLICDCNSFEHQLIFWSDEDFTEKSNRSVLYVVCHLTTYHNFFKRLWYGLKYAFGHTSNYGAFDEFIFSKDDEIKLKKYLDSKKGTL